MRAFVTGATGFVGGRLVERLRERGDDVVVLVRSPAKASRLRELRCELVEGDLADEHALRLGVEGADAVFHVGAVYEIGTPPERRGHVFDVNVRGTERVLDAAAAAGVSRVVHVSTVNVFGNTRGRVVDETYERPGGDFLSWYDETKWLAHRAARERGATLALPGLVYGPGDTSQMGGQIRAAMRGRLPLVSFPELGFNAVHVDDVATGLLLAAERGRPGESYVLGGQLTTMRETIETAAGVAGRRPPPLTMRGGLLKAIAPLGPWLGPLVGLPPNLRELVTASDGVTYWARDDRARAELGYAPRDLEAGLRATYQALLTAR